MVKDILTVPAQAIVNAANPELAHYGGIAKTIAKAAGPGFEKECSDYIETCRVFPDGKRTRHLIMIYSMLVRYNLPPIIFDIYFRLDIGALYFVWDKYVYL